MKLELHHVQNHKRILLLVCQRQNAIQSCVHPLFSLFHMVQGSGQLEKVFPVAPTGCKTPVRISYYCNACF